MSEFVFNSPKVIIREKDISFNEPAIQGITAVGLVGETLKGPAFEPIAVSTKSAFRALFGGKSTEKNGPSNMKYLLPYYADSYLEEGNQLYVVRVLGKSGYNAGNAWAVTLSGSGVLNGMTGAVLRSRKYTTTGGTRTNLVTSSTVLTLAVGNATDPFSKTLTFTPNIGPTQTLLISLDPSSPDFITKVLGTDPKNGLTALYVENIFTETITKGIGDGNLLSFGGVSSAGPVASFETHYQHPETPYVVSELRGNAVSPLYKFICISDGDSANTEIKISHENIDPITKEFDVVIRDFNDRDDNVITLERFSKCSLNPQSNNYVGRRIGSCKFGEVELEFALNSKYVFLEMAANVPADAFPAGFEGYVLPQAGAVAPKMYFKKSYTATDRVNRTFLGISERAYDTLGTKGRGINKDMFSFRGDLSTATPAQLPGFHMDANVSGRTFANGLTFETSNAGFRTFADVSGTAPFAQKTTRKFTFAPYGGFDGWDIFAPERTNTDSYKPGSPAIPVGKEEVTDYQAFLDGILQLSNNEQVDIALIATPGLNWLEHLGLVNETLDMVETVRRGDCLYIMDSPDLSNSDTVAQDLVESFDIADIDSSFATTYWPHIQIEDKDNNTLVYIPATGEVLRAMAYTDKVKFPWWAPAGYSRGLIQKAKRTRRKLKEAERDILYTGRINPIADFSEVGVDIFGQKTTQRRESALDRISVRRMLIYAKGIIAKISRQLIFDQNDDVVQSQFLTKVNPVLETIKRERGIERFSVIPTEENTPEARSRHQLFFSIRCLPIGALEEIGIDFVVTPAGTTFTN